MCIHVYTVYIITDYAISWLLSQLSIWLNLAYDFCRIINYQSHGQWGWWQGLRFSHLSLGDLEDAWRWNPQSKGIERITCSFLKMWHSLKPNIVFKRNINWSWQGRSWWVVIFVRNFAPPPRTPPALRCCSKAPGVFMSWWMPGKRGNSSLVATGCKLWIHLGSINDPQNGWF